MTNDVRQTRAIEREISRLPCTGVSIENSRAKAVITGLTQGGFSGPGKVWAGYFYPYFCKALHAAGIETSFVSTAEALKSAIDHGRTIVIHVYNEEGDNEPLLCVDAEQLGAKGVWNSPQNIDIIADKQKTNVFLADIDIRVPELVEGLTNHTCVFSNAHTGSHLKTYLINDSAKLDPKRYNTRFIDTRRSFDGKTYHSSVRLMCVGTELVMAWVRLRDAAEGSPSVHSRDTPLEPHVITHFQKLLVQDRLAELKVLAERIGNALGPSFYSHDLVTESDTGNIYVCEVGLKLSDDTYGQHLLSLRDRLPGMEPCFSPVYPQDAARAFVRECARHGWLQLSEPHLID